MAYANFTNSSHVFQEKVNERISTSSCKFLRTKYKTVNTYERLRGLQKFEVPSVQKGIMVPNAVPNRDAGVLQYFEFFIA